MAPLAALALSGCLTPSQAVEPTSFALGSDAPLDWLAGEIGDARIVQLGENTHGIAEYNEIKTDLVIALHRDHGFDVVAFESDFYQCADTERRIGSMPTREAMQSCLLGVWQTKGVERLFDYILSTRDTGRPLRIAGFDVQPIGSNKAARPDYLAAAAARAGMDAEQVRAMDREMLATYDLGGRERRAAWRGENGQRFLSFYRELAHRLGTAGEGEAARVAASLAAYLGQERAADWDERTRARDGGMAENMLWLANVRYPDARIVTWGHNYHLREANELVEPHPDMFTDAASPTMGTWLSQAFGDDLFTVGFYAARGMSRDNSLEPFDLVAAGDDSLEARALATGAGAARWVSTKAALPDVLDARYDGRYPLTMEWRRQYDALVVVRDATPSRSFYVETP